VADRDEPEMSGSEWHGDSMAGEDDRDSHLAAVAPARAMGETRPGRHQPRWQASARCGSKMTARCRAPWTPCHLVVDVLRRRKTTVRLAGRALSFPLIAMGCLESWLTERLQLR
jgi:hypothetical protein